MSVLKREIDIVVESAVGLSTDIAENDRVRFW
jgi:hypothetical protein